MEGLLSKKGSLLGTFNKRYAVLCKCELQLFEVTSDKQQKQKLVETIDLRQCGEVRDGKDVRDFVLRMADGREHTMRASSYQQKEIWIGVLGVFHNAHSKDAIEIPGATARALITCIEYLHKYGTKTEHIFESKGDDQMTKQLIIHLLSESHHNLARYDVLTIAAATKHMLATMPESLFTNKYCNQFIMQKTPQNLQNLCKELPSENNKILDKLCNLLSIICFLNASETNLDIEKISRALEPVLLTRSNQMMSSNMTSLLACLVEQKEFIFRNGPLMSESRGSILEGRSDRTIDASYNGQTSVLHRSSLSSVAPMRPPTIPVSKPALAMPENVVGKSNDVVALKTSLSRPNSSDRQRNSILLRRNRLDTDLDMTEEPSINTADFTDDATQFDDQFDISDKNHSKLKQISSQMQSDAPNSVVPKHSLSQVPLMEQQRIAAKQAPAHRELSFSSHHSSFDDEDSIFQRNSDAELELDDDDTNFKNGTHSAVTPNYATSALLQMRTLKSSDQDKQPMQTRPSISGKSQHSNSSRRKALRVGVNDALFSESSAQLIKNAAHRNNNNTSDSSALDVSNSFDDDFDSTPQADQLVSKLRRPDPISVPVRNQTARASGFNLSPPLVPQSSAPKNFSAQDIVVNQLQSNETVQSAKTSAPNQSKSTSPNAQAMSSDDGSISTFNNDDGTLTFGSVFDNSEDQPMREVSNVVPVEASIRGSSIKANSALTADKPPINATIAHTSDQASDHSSALTISLMREDGTISSFDDSFQNHGLIAGKSDSQQKQPNSTGASVSNLKLSKKVDSSRQSVQHSYHQSKNGQSNEPNRAKNSAHDHFSNSAYDNGALTAGGSTHSSLKSTMGSHQNPESSTSLTHPSEIIRLREELDSKEITLRNLQDRISALEKELDLLRNNGSNSTITSEKHKENIEEMQRLLLAAQEADAKSKYALVSVQEELAQAQTRIHHIETENRQLAADHAQLAEKSRALDSLSDKTKLMHSDLMAKHAQTVKDYGAEQIRLLDQLEAANKRAMEANEMYAVVVADRDDIQTRYNIAIKRNRMLEAEVASYRLQQLKPTYDPRERTAHQQELAALQERSIEWQEKERRWLEQEKALHAQITQYEKQLLDVDHKLQSALLIQNRSELQLRSKTQQLEYLQASLEMFENESNNKVRALEQSLAEKNAELQGLLKQSKENDTTAGIVPLNTEKFITNEDVRQQNQNDSAEKFRESLALLPSEEFDVDPQASIDSVPPNGHNSLFSGVQANRPLFHAWSLHSTAAAKPVHPYSFEDSKRRLAEIEQRVRSGLERSHQQLRRGTIDV